MKIRKLKLKKTTNFKYLIKLRYYFPYFSAINDHDIPKLCQNIKDNLGSSCKIVKHTEPLMRISTKIYVVSDADLVVVMLTYPDIIFRIYELI